MSGCKMHEFSFESFTSILAIKLMPGLIWAGVELSRAPSRTKSKPFRAAGGDEEASQVPGGLGDGGRGR